jgi:hypothetical protein
MKLKQKMRRTDIEPVQLSFTFKNLLKLHDPKEDGRFLKKWIRVTSKEKGDKLYRKLLYLLEFIKKKENISRWPDFRKYLSKKLRAHIDITTLYGWRGGSFNGKKRAIPIKVLDFAVKEYCKHSNSNYETLWSEIYNDLDTVVVSGGLKSILIKDISTELSYLVGMIVADGSCPHSFSSKQRKYKEYKMTLSKDNKKFIEQIASSFQKTTGISPRISHVMSFGSPVWVMDVKSKYICRLLNRIFRLPRGKKAHIVRMPLIIKNSTKENQLAFIRGVMDGDGSIQVSNQITRESYGTYHHLKFQIVLRVVSKNLIEDITSCLKKHGYAVNKFTYLGNTFDRTEKTPFYGLYVIGKNARKYAQEIGSLNPAKSAKIDEYYQQASVL